MPVKTAEPVRFTSMKVPNDVVRMIDQLATMDDISIQEWNHTELRRYVSKKFRERITKRAAELGGESGA